MVKIHEFRTLEEGIILLHKEAQYLEAKNKQISIKEILRILSGKGRSLILILLSLPFCQPIQIPGMSMPFGVAIAFVGLRMAFGKKMWLPNQLLSKTIPNHTLEKITDKTLSIVRKIKRWIHPRLYWACHSSFMEIMNGLIICLLGFLLALPLPIPLSNLIAAWSIFLVALGILEDDGLFVLIGYGLSFLTLTLFVTMALSIRYIF